MIASLEKIKKTEEEKGRFAAQEGDIDQRGAEKKDIQLSRGFNRDCGIKGGKLSGGQKQRVAIARAIIRRPNVLILDEATSALDEESQRKVQGALDNIMVDRTSIVIAHRLSTVEKCDRILVLESGVLVEEGGFTELRTKQDGVFAQLMAFAVDEINGGHDHAGGAETALQTVMLAEGRLHGVQFATLCQPLNGHNARALAGQSQRGAGFDRLAINMHHTGAALAGVTADMRAGEMLVFADKLHQQGARINQRRN